MQKILHLPVSYLPWKTGGKEVFTHNLSLAQVDRGQKPLIAIHQEENGKPQRGIHWYEGVEVEVLPPRVGTGKRSAVYGCAPDLIPGFDALLEERQPDIVHFHDFSVGATLLHISAAKAAGCRIVWTYHSPGQICTQRSLLYRGEEICDGRLDADRCSRCRLGVSGVPEWLANALGRIGSLGFPIDTKNRLGRVLTVKNTVRLFQEAWAECVSLVDRFTVHADWCAEVLRKNGVPDEKVVMVRSGWHGETGAVPPPARRRVPSESLRVAFVGRADPVKGVHVLVEAVQSLPAKLPVEVSFFGPYWEDAYGAELAERVRGDRRFLVPEQLAPNDLMRRLGEFDVCVVPSLWLETGPLVVLEAFAVGLPVLGSRLGGIAELVTDGVDGLLFEPRDAKGLGACLQRLVEEPELLDQLRAGIRPPRTMTDVAGEMAKLYDKLVADR